MALDPLEKERLRRKMAFRMGVFLESGNRVSCVSGHFYWEPHDCELCESSHATELLVIKNRSGRKCHVAASCLMEMVRFQVAEVEDFAKWLDKLKELRIEAERRRMEEIQLREEERKKLEKRVIVRKRPQENG